ncbi:MAG: GrpB family protein [Gammaproteobacteria bacterium]|nr:GrpB family protein [Gammaproteobacteria bacterium]
MILVVKHNPDWARLFEQEAHRIRLAVGGTAVQIHHIGSTAISHTKAKPVIDILLEATSLDSLDQKNQSLEALGYEAKGEFGIPGRRYFRLDDATGRRTHQIHAFEAGVQNVIRHIAFRDYMRAHPPIAVEYGELKERLARENPNDMEAYIDGKDSFVKEHERRALLWVGNDNEQTSA